MTHARPAVPAPRIEEVSELGFYPNEAAEYVAILSKPYASLDEKDCSWICEEGEVFLPAHHLRYFAPALIEHCRSQAEYNVYACNQVLMCLLKAHPLPDAPQLAPKLVSLAASLWPRRLAQPPRGIDWRDRTTVELPGGRILRVALELDPSSLDECLSASAGPAAMAIVELALGVFEEDWTLPAQPSVSERLLDALERIALGPELHASLGARYVLGEVPPDELPCCSSLDCRAHSEPGS